MKAVKKGTSIISKKPLHTSPKDVFIHLLMLVMLYLGVISLIALSFAYINYSFPDPLNYYSYGILESIRIQSSMLVVSFPLLLILARIIQRDFRMNPAKHQLRFRKWLVYLTLFIAALTIVIDLIQLVNRFYGGELTTSFVLKVLSVLIVAGAVFSYYIWDVQHEPHKSKIPSLVATIASVVIIVILASGFFIVGSPSAQRQMRMDERRISDLQMIQSEVMNYWQMKKVLPTSLEVLRNDINGFNVPLDPETNLVYDYSVSGPLKFSLCSSFNKTNLSEDNPYSKLSAPIYYERGYGGGLSESWGHQAGRFCFERTIDPDLFPKM